ncbi:YciI family protein [Aquimarina agarilytica]|uniref:YciI family protein n=1 Tax=Aquimarina agarilytica TaxID=1087449 RepID=UPI000288C0EB|nr:YciI family protein [Aquimarina agarilytica]
MKEFMLFIRSEGNPVAKLSPEQQQEHVQKVGGFIKKMVDEGKMKSAQPLEMQGSILSFDNNSFIDGPFNETKEVISGYYHILAKDLNEAIGIAKSDPRFEDGKWRIEIRPVMKVDGINE